MSRLKKIGIVGGTAWPTTVHYYSLICRQSEARYGCTPEFTIESLDLKRAVSMFGDDDDAGSWRDFDGYYREALERIAASGAQLALFASNTPHHRFAEITHGIGIHVVSIVDAVAEAARTAGHDNLLLLGTHVTMRSAPIRDAFAKAGVIVEAADPHEWPEVAALIDRLQHGDADGAADAIEALTRGRPAMLGCTELAMAFPEHVETPVFSIGESLYFNSLAIHADQIIRLAASQVLGHVP